MKALFLTLLMATSSTLAAAAPDTLEKATEALNQGDFATAAQGYETAVKDGDVNGHLFYNLGIAYVRSGKTGDAMAAFLAARHLLPRDPDVQANLKSTLGSVKDKLDTEVPKSFGHTLAFWLDRYTVKEFAYATSLTLGLISLLVGLSVFVAPLARFRWFFVAAYLIPVVCGISLGVKAQNDETWGAVIANDTKAYSGPSDKNPAVFELSEGAPVLVREEVPGGYFRVQLSDGKRGWIPATQVKVF